MKFWRIKWENLVGIYLKITLIALISIFEGKVTDYIMISVNAVMIPYSYILLKKTRKEIRKYER